MIIIGKRENDHITVGDEWCELFKFDQKDNARWTDKWRANWMFECSSASTILVENWGEE